MTRRRGSATGARVTLDASFAECKRLNRASGTTYYWSTQLLPALKRPYVHALYGFCRYADDIVDEVSDRTVEDRATALADFGDRFFVDLDRGRSDDLVLKAVVHTARAFDLDPDCFRRFLRSMAMDLDTSTYETFDDLLRYTDGSAAVIGELMLPVLEPRSPEALGHARDLGVAFQLTNFLRDIAEDLQRGRVYVPQEDIERFGAQLAWDTQSTTPQMVELMRFEIARTRALYTSADIGIALLDGRARRCVEAARGLYGGILDQIEALDHDVWSGRARISAWRKVAAGVGILRP